MDFSIRKFAVATSTNRICIECARAGEGEGTVIWALEQSDGRGRQGRSWHSSPGEGLSFSLLLRPKCLPEKAMTLPLMVGIAVSKALDKYLLPGNQVSIKWPNDLLINGKKLCGILCEMESSLEGVSHVVAGVGVNINTKNFPEELREKATSLYLCIQRENDLCEILGAILTSIEEIYSLWDERGFEAILPEIRARDFLLGRELTIELIGKPVRGTACGIAPSGALLLKTDNGTQEIYSGEAHIVSG